MHDSRKILATCAKKQETDHPSLSFSSKYKEFRPVSQAATVQNGPPSLSAPWCPTGCDTPGLDLWPVSWQTTWPDMRKFKVTTRNWSHTHTGQVIVLNHINTHIICEWNLLVESDIITCLELWLLCRNSSTEEQAERKLKKHQHKAQIYTFTHMDTLFQNNVSSNTAEKLKICTQISTRYS